MSKRIGIVGAGTMGSRYAAMLASGDVPGATLAGVCDLRTDAVADCAGQWNVPAFDSIDALLAAEAPDAVYIATPDAHHRDPALRAFAAGVPALIEKPLATTVEDGEAIVAAADRAGVVAEVNYSNRWNPPFVQARAAVDDGRIGVPVTLAARLNNTIASPRDRLTWASGTTPAWFLMSHCLDLAHWLHGLRAERVYATGRRGLLDSLNISTWDSITALVTYEGGVTGTFESTWILPESHPSPIEFELRLAGARGALTVNTTEQMLRLASDRFTTPTSLAWGPARLRAFLNALDGGPTGCPLEAGLEVTRILVAIHRSLQSGQVEPIRQPLPAGGSP